MSKTNNIESGLRHGVSLILCAVAACMTSASAQVTFRVVSYLNQLQQPIGITEGSPGVLYSNGGWPNRAVFSVTTQGSKTVLASFPSGHGVAPVVSAANGRFYSVVTYLLNPVNVFSVSAAAGSKQIYAPQTLGVEFTQNLPDSMLLGLAGTLSTNPTWYLAKSDLKGNVTTVYQFPAGETLPLTAIYASDVNYYGVSIVQQNASGYVYRITPSGSLTKLVSFPNNSFMGVNFYVPLLQASDGNLYGVTPSGSAKGTATFYKLTLGGQYTLLHTFPAGPNYDPTALLEGSDGNFYGSTLGVGSQLIRLTKSGQYTLLHTMDQIQDGQCSCQLTQGSDGIIYGSAQQGGIYGGGDIFALDAGLPKPAPKAQSFHPSSGPVGTQVRIWGHNLLSAAVEFNGVAATTVTSSGPNYVWATVPAGAITGPITVTTPGGTYTTAANFTVE